MVIDQGVTHDIEEPEAKPVITVVTAHGGAVTTKVVGGDRSVTTTYPSSSHPDGVLPYA